MTANRTTPIHLWGDHPAQLEYFTWQKPADACWSFRGFVNSSSGYGQLGRNIPAHRVAWEVANGRPVPEGLVIDHTCHNADLSCNDNADCAHRRCVNPAHLEAVTFRENVHRGRGFAGPNASRTECPKGHKYDDANTYWYGGKRQCAACRQASNDLNSAKMRARRGVSDYQFKIDPTLPPTIGWGPGVQILLDGTLLGYARRINPGAPGRQRFMIYRPDGSESGICYRRKDGADHLRAEAMQRVGERLQLG